MSDDSALSIAADVRAGRRSAVEVTAAALERIAASQDRLNAFTLVLDDLAIEAATTIDRRIAAGDDPGPLAGVPVAVKDLFDQAGVTTTNGSSFAAKPATATATAVARMQRAGAVVVGRTGLHEYAFGFSSENHWFGPVRNPWDPGSSPGGSSGGSGAAVAARLTPLALGTDTGGSVRVPAALCAVTGLKVTHGRIPLTGVTPLASSFDTVGPLGRSVGDVALAYRIMAGYDPDDPWSLPQPVEVPGEPPPLRGLRFGVPVPWTNRSLTAPVASGWRSFLDALRACGATVVTVELPDVSFPGLVTDAMYPEVAAVHRRRFTASPEGYGPEVRRRIAATMETGMDGYLAGLAWRRRMRLQMEQALDDCAALLTPSVAALRKVIGEDHIDIGGEPVGYRVALSCFSALVNQTGLPAISLPIAVAGNPPPSVQLIGPAWGEQRLLEIAAALERAELVAVPTPPG